MRKSLQIMLGSDPDMEIVGQAKDGKEGVEMAKRLDPDVITLDIEMPVMDGLKALEIIMKERPTSVLMVSSLTTEGADATIKALELGAVDFIPKEMSYVNVKIQDIKDDLIRKIKTIVQRKIISRTIQRLRAITGKTDRDRDAIAPAPPPSKLPPKIGYKAVMVGVSTGGPLSLQKVVPELSISKLKIPIFLVQHMPPKFTRSLAERLNDMSEVEVKEAEHNEIVRGGVVYIAPGGKHMRVRSGGGEERIDVGDKPEEALHRPSVSVTMESVLDVYGKHTLGVMMTGMGRDGADAFDRLKNLGGHALAQDESTCVVYGMPKAVVDAGAADTVLTLDRIAPTINEIV
jgi:two-component system, chemotaxis family, protein-glutamate methylesterase/glutaminase